MNEVVMDQPQAKQLAQQFIDQLHRVEDGNPDSVDALVGLFSDDAELSNTIMESQASRCVGRDRIAQFWRGYKSSFGAIHSDFFDVTTSDHSAALFWRSTGTGQSGLPVSYEGVSLLMFDNAGKIRQFKGYFDPRQTQTKAQAH
jgi:hypothetical protein